MFFVNAAHQCCCWRQDLIDEDKDGLLGRELDALADDVNELTDGEICWHKVLFLVDSRDVRFLNLLADDL